jgi:hypothetical protein
MRFLLDESADLPLATYLRRLGHDAVQTGALELLEPLLG